MIKEDIKFQDSAVFEGMTSIRSILRGNDSGTNDRGIEKILFDKGKFQKNAKNIGYLKAVSQNYGFELVESNEEEINEITLGTSHGGIIAIAKERTIPYLTKDSNMLILEIKV